MTPGAQDLDRLINWDITKWRVPPLHFQCLFLNTPSNQSICQGFRRQECFQLIVPDVSFGFCDVPLQTNALCCLFCSLQILKALQLLQNQSHEFPKTNFIVFVKAMWLECK